MSLPPWVEQVFVVHSPRLRERREALEATLERHGIAATWVTEPEAGDLALLRRLRSLRLTPGEVSVYLKHEAVLRLVASGPAEVALVLEDDALLEDDFPERFEEQGSHLPVDFDVVFLGESCDLHAPLGDNPCFARATSSRSASGYLVTRKAAAALVADLERIDRPIDHKLSQCIQARHLACYWGEPPLIGNGSSRGVHPYSLGAWWKRRG